METLVLVQEISSSCGGAVAFFLAEEGETETTLREVAQGVDILL